MVPAAYLDECVHTGLPALLRQRGYEATAACDAGVIGVNDAEQLAYASARGWVIVSHNARHFVRLHRALQAQGKPHGGIVILGEARPLSRLALRVAMMLDWLETQGHRSKLVKWGTLQLLLTQGYRLPGYTEEEMRHALGQG